MKQFMNYFGKNRFNYRAGSEGDKWEGLTRGHFYNDIIIPKRISGAILFMPQRGKKQSSGLSGSRIFLILLLFCFVLLFSYPLLGDWKENKRS